MKINFKNKKWIGYGIIILGILLLILSFLDYFNFFGNVIPYGLSIIILEAIGGIVSIMGGILIIFTKNSNKFTLLGSYIIIGSILFYMEGFLHIGGVETGKYTLKGAIYTQSSLILSTIGFIIGIILFLIGKNRLNK